MHGVHDLRRRTYKLRAERTLFISLFYARQKATIGDGCRWGEMLGRHAGNFPAYLLRFRVMPVVWGRRRACRREKSSRRSQCVQQRNATEGVPYSAQGGPYSAEGFPYSAQGVPCYCIKKGWGMKPSGMKAKVSQPRRMRNQPSGSSSSRVGGCFGPM